MARDLQLSIRRSARFSRNPYKVKLVKNSWHGMNFTPTGHEFLASNGVVLRSMGDLVGWYRDTRLLCLPSRPDTSRVSRYDYTNVDPSDAQLIRDAYAEYRKRFCRGGKPGMKKEEKEDADRALYHLRLGIRGR